MSSITITYCPGGILSMFIVTQMYVILLFHYINYKYRVCLCYLLQQDRQIARSRKIVILEAYLNYFYTQINFGERKDWNPYLKIQSQGTVFTTFNSVGLLFMHQPNISTLSPLYLYFQYGSALAAPRVLQSAIYR